MKPRHRLLIVPMLALLLGLFLSTSAHAATSGTWYNDCYWLPNGTQWQLQGCQYLGDDGSTYFYDYLSQNAYVLINNQWAPWTASETQQYTWYNNEYWFWDGAQWSRVGGLTQGSDGAFYYHDYGSDGWFIAVEGAGWVHLADYQAAANQSIGLQVVNQSMWLQQMQTALNLQQNFFRSMFI